jgi:hypothetical protein
MTSDSPFNFDMSVSSDKKKRNKGRRSASGAVDTSSRVCEHDGCQQPGKYRAPKTPDNTEEFFWFCLDHVRAYNLKWNFFENHSERELEEQLNSDRVWERPTKPFSSVGEQGETAEQKAWARLGIEDPTEILGEKGTNASARGAVHSRRLSATERRAIDILEAKETWTKPEIRVQYKKLVKYLHPDLNGGLRNDEDRLQEVVWAWEQLKDSRSFKS